MNRIGLLPLLSLGYLLTLGGCPAGSGFVLQGSVDTAGLGSQRRALVVFLVPDPPIDSARRPLVLPGTTLRVLVADALAPTPQRTFQYEDEGCTLDRFALVAWSPVQLPSGLGNPGDRATGSVFTPGTTDPVVIADGGAADCDGTTQSLRLTLPALQ